MLNYTVYTYFNVSVSTQSKYRIKTAIASGTVIKNNTKDTVIHRI